MKRRRWPFRPLVVRPVIIQGKEKTKGTPPRDVVWTNEGFFITVLQAISGGSLIAGMTQADLIDRFASRLILLLFVTLLGLALICALAAAFWRHWYKLWDLKAGVSLSRGDIEEAAKRSKFSTRDLRSMRLAFTSSFWLVVAAYGVLISGLWYRFV